MLHMDARIRVSDPFGRGRRSSATKATKRGRGEDSSDDDDDDDDDDGGDARARSPSQVPGRDLKLMQRAAAD